ncbi:MAG: hypothetical protein HKN13_04025 [Rhodothermales bacterium]|nr:hypothetical protein [Rhodothermales bacterium]
MKTHIILALLAIGIAATSTVSAQSTASHDVTIAVTAIDEIVVSGNVTLTINSITLSETASATYGITTNAVARKIAASLDSDYSPTLTLEVAVAAPTTSGTSAGTVTLSSAAQDVVTGISSVAASGLAIDYTATALPTTLASTSETRTVTYTITS